MSTLHLTGDAAADAHLSANPFALLIGMLLDQQVAIRTDGSLVGGAPMGSLGAQRKEVAPVTSTHARRTSGRPVTAREEVLVRGLIDWVAFERVHHYVALENSGRPLAAIQEKALELVHALASDGLFELGDMSGEDGRFAAWDSSLDDSIQRIRDAYIADFGDESLWWFCCWLDLTDKGQQIAEAIEARTGATNGN